MKRSAGFTLTELITVIVILAILAAVAIPRMDTSGYRALEFRDKTVAALRYAQKTATSHRRLVCVALAPTSVTLEIAKAQSATSCGATPLIIPGSPNNQVVSGDTTNVKFGTGYPTTIFFQPDGRGTADGAGTTVISGTTTTPTLTIAGVEGIVVVGETGHVQ